MQEPGPCWIDGRLVDRRAAALSVTDSALTSGRGCYTTARYTRGEIRFLRRHAARLVRDARTLSIGPVSADRVCEALLAVAVGAFGATGDGVVRVQASRDGDGGVHLYAVPRLAGPEPASWRAVRAGFPHEGPMPWSGAKVTNHLLYALAAEVARARDANEALLCDRDGYLVEGSRSNLLWVDGDGELCTPDPSRGGVAGIGLAVLRERAPEIRVRHLPASRLQESRELIAVNAVRGPRSIVELDGQPIGDGRPGPVAARLRALFDAA
jgi:D-alanine transaminase